MTAEPPAGYAWWHAYGKLRRRLVYVGFVVVTLLLALADFAAPPTEG
ncbi:hypothetical protein Drose_09360 [Dactylosporangium roseum]|uniref:ABC transporter permease n=1 Tax=Dactylosporangium roseum TaxID=47989 RepID=A0ABY5ZAC7_9ACTN|nr:hypothetical protein [Dactylosporangium roseum]UWZ38422.1 hypothetical protein Drose_09360 [Dactylosporangium roseum]